MNKSNRAKILCKLACSLSVILFLLLISQNTSSQVTYRDTIFTWKHFDYTLDGNNGMGSYSTTDIVETDLTGIVLENEYVRLVILPEFGARVISYYYKPSGHEQLYTNPVGTPYGMGDGNFYYDWLMVLGGIFPTFPEPEHGKTWFLPWQWEFTEITANKVSLKMEFMDTVNYPNHPGKFNNGITGIRCTSVISLENGRTGFDLDHTLENTKNVQVPFEYWTCLTLAPGSEPGNTYTPANSEIVAPIEYIYLKDDWWNWMGSAETPAYEQGSHVFEFKNLAIYDNWDDMGIGYAFPSIEADHFGVINHENNEGVFRVADNSGLTGGMKFWTWGAEQGLGADPLDFHDIARPYIELWSGLSNQFFEDAYLSPDETLSFKETYLPTIGLEYANAVNGSGAVHLKHTAEGAEKLETGIFMSRPGITFGVSVSLEGASSIQLFNGEFTSDGNGPYRRSFFVDDHPIEDGEYNFTARVFDALDNEVLKASIPVTIPYQSQGIGPEQGRDARLLRLTADTYKIELPGIGKKTISVFTVGGQLIDKRVISGNEAFIHYENSGLLIIHIHGKNYSHSVKLLF